MKWIIGISYFCEMAQGDSFGDSDIFFCEFVTIQKNEMAAF